MSNLPGSSLPKRDSLEKLASRESAIDIAILGLGGVCGIAAAYRFATYKLEYLPKSVWLLACAVTAIALGLAGLVSRQGSGLSQHEKMRFRLLTLGGILGFLTAALGLILPFVEYLDIFAGGLKSWRENPRALLWTGGALFGGLTLMFASLQLARGVERTSPNLRRLLYGYNAVLGVFLLVAVLGLINVLPYTKVWPFKALGDTYDWTAGANYTLSESAKNTLAELQQPVKVYVLMYQDDLATHEMESLLKNCAALSSQLTWTSWSPDRNLQQLVELRRDYPFPEPNGVLVIYGTKPSTQWEFIKYDDIVGTPPFNPRDPSAPRKFTFKGENALMKSIRQLRDGKNPIIYFTQGNGELDINDRGEGQSLDRAETGLGILNDRLAKNSYVIKELRLGPTEKSVPDDADLVVVARPGGNGVPMNDTAFKALRDYMQGGAGGKKGKLIVLLDVVTRPDGGMVKTGLESLLQEFGVKSNDDRILCERFRDSTQILAVVNSRSTNPIARAFASEEGPLPLFFSGARSVDVAPAAPGGPHTAEVLVQTVAGMSCFLQTDLAASPQALLADLRKPENREKYKSLITTKPIPLAVTVSDSSGPPPGLPMGHVPVDKDSTPRMVVFGDTTWVSNRIIASSQFGGLNYELFLNCLTWLREKPEIGRQLVPDVERREYKPTFVSAKGEDRGDFARLQWLPSFLMLLAVLGLAGGVWVVRRR